jgi:hypothetical protein
MVWMIVQGPQVGVYKNYARFIEARDRPYSTRAEEEPVNGNYSWKACRFLSEGDALEWIEARDFTDTSKTPVRPQPVPYI